MTLIYNGVFTRYFGHTVSNHEIHVCINPSSVFEHVNDLLDPFNICNKCIEAVVFFELLKVRLAACGLRLAAYGSMRFETNSSVTTCVFSVHFWHGSINNDERRFLNG